jgi:hypothetical protein
MNSIKLGELITEEEATNLVYVVSTRPDGATVHNTIMGWIDKHPEVQKRFVKHGVLKAYGAYVFEYQLQLK